MVSLQGISFPQIFLFQKKIRNLSKRINIDRKSERINIDQKSKRIISIRRNFSTTKSFHKMGNTLEVKKETKKTVVTVTTVVEVSHETLPSAFPEPVEKVDKLQTDKLQTDKLQTDKLQTDKLQTDKLQTDKLQTDKLCIRCGRTSHFVDRCYAKIDVKGNSLVCTICGRSSHKTSACYAKTHSNGSKILPRVTPKLTQTVAMPKLTQTVIK
jgi:hypothetical protein